MSGLSKVAGLPQMKLGWIVVSGPAALRAEALGEAGVDRRHVPLGRHAGAVRRRAPARRGRHVQRQIRARTAANLAFARATLAGSPGQYLAVEGGWYITLQVPRIHSEEEWTLACWTRDVLVQPGFFYDFECEAYLVVSLLTAPDIFREGLTRLVTA